jgi:hypothetical protein
VDMFTDKYTSDGVAMNPIITVYELTKRYR